MTLSLKGASLGDGDIRRLQLGAQFVAGPSFLLSATYFSLGTGSKGQFCPQAAGQVPELMLRGARGRGQEPTGPLQLGAEIEASTPCGCSIWERLPGPRTQKQAPLGGQGFAAAWALSARESCPRGGQVVFPQPASHIPSASLGNNHTPHTEETQSTDSGFLDTPVASKNSRAMTKQIGIWTANNASTRLPGRARASVRWALLPFPLLFLKQSLVAEHPSPRVSWRGSWGPRGSPAQGQCIGLGESCLGSSLFTHVHRQALCHSTHT